MTRCDWARKPLDIEYHDREWGTPVHDDRTLFEFLILEGAQAGLSWSTILNKREGYRKAFANFDARKVARFAVPHRQERHSENLPEWIERLNCGRRAGLGCRGRSIRKRVLFRCAVPVRTQVVGERRSDHCRGRRGTWFLG